MIGYPCFDKVPEHGISNLQFPGKQALSLKKPTGRGGILFFKMEGCPHCVRAASALHEWSEKTKRVVHMVDSNSSIVKSFSPRIDGFPAIFAVNSAGNIYPKQYTGERTPRGFEEFVRRFD